MNQHTVQKAYLKLFEDPTGRVQVYRKTGGKPFDDVAQVIAVGLSSTTALRGSTEHEQFH